MPGEATACDLIRIGRLERRDTAAPPSDVGNMSLVRGGGIIADFSTRVEQFYSLELEYGVRCGHG